MADGAIPVFVFRQSWKSPNPLCSQLRFTCAPPEGWENFPLRQPRRSVYLAQRACAPPEGWENFPLRQVFRVPPSRTFCNSTYLLRDEGDLTRNRYLYEF